MQNAQKKINLKAGVVHTFPGIGMFATETIKAYYEAGWLLNMYTTVVVHSGKKWVKVLKWISPSLVKKFKHRYFGIIPCQMIKLYPFKEMLRLFSVRYFSLITTDKIWEWAEISYDKWAARQLNSSVKLVHAYEHAALETFKKAGDLGIVKILEQTSQHYQFYTQILNDQVEKYPELKSDYNEQVSGELFDKRNQRKALELQLADFIICNSSFTRDTLTQANIDFKKIILVPLAYPKPIQYLPKQNTLEKVNFLYAGSLSLRKGTHILINVWRNRFASTPNASLILVGKNLLPDSFINNLPDNVKILDFVDQNTLTTLYDNADVFVFPTLADGFGMVITEAMARGLPVLTTRNSAGPDLIEDGYDGLLINAGNADELADKMQWCLHNTKALESMRERAIKKAEKWQWADYRKELIKQISAKISE